MSLLQKTASVHVHGVRHYAFIISFLLGLSLVVIYLLLFSCSYTATEYKDWVCDLAMIQQYQLITLCPHQGECTLTTFKNNNLLQYDGKPLSNCTSTTTALNFLNQRGIMSWSQLSNTITCNDSKVNFSLLTLATQDGTDKIFRESQNFISAIEDDLTAQKVTNVDDVISGMTSIYWTGLNNTHYTLAPSAGGEYSRTLEGYTLPNFDSWLAPFIDGATISTGYICHNCFTNRGPFNGAFWAKFLVGLSSLGSTMFTVTAMILTYKFVVEFQAKVRDELTGSEHVSTIDKEDSIPLYQVHQE